MLLQRLLQMLNNFNSSLIDPQALILWCVCVLSLGWNLRWRTIDCRILNSADFSRSGCEKATFVLYRAGVCCINSRSFSTATTIKGFYYHALILLWVLCLNLCVSSEQSCLQLGRDHNCTPTLIFRSLELPIVASNWFPFNWNSIWQKTKHPFSANLKLIISVLRAIHYVWRRYCVSL